MLLLLLLLLLYYWWTQKPTNQAKGTQSRAKPAKAVVLPAVRVKNKETSILPGMVI